MRPYVVTRSYQVFKSGQQRSEFQASGDYAPTMEKRFVLTRTSGGMAERVVRKALEKEVELARDPELTELSPANYSFALLGAELIDGHHCYLLQITALRESTNLLN